MPQHSKRGRRMKVSFEILFWFDKSKALTTTVDYHLHEYILALWGMPLGEMLDLEKLSQTCREKNRWTFFFTAAPANVQGNITLDMFLSILR
jgi:hypothetical protein